MFQFDSINDCGNFTSMCFPAPSPLLSRARHNDDSSSTLSLSSTCKTSAASLISLQQSQTCTTELDKLIIYFQGVKLKNNFKEPKQLRGR